MVERKPAFVVHVETSSDMDVADRFVELDADDLGHAGDRAPMGQAMGNATPRSAAYAQWQSCTSRAPSSNATRGAPAPRKLEKNPATKGSEMLYRRYMNKHEINEMAQAALGAYTDTGHWPDAYGAARKYAEETLGAKPDSAQVFAAVTIARSNNKGEE